MAMTMQPKPIIFLAFANDKEDNTRYLRNLPLEHNGIRKALQEAEKQGLCEVVERANTTIETLFDVFQDSRYRDRIAIFHYGGHANGYQLLLETLSMVENQTLSVNEDPASGSKRLLGSATTNSVGNSLAHAAGLVPFFARQKGLQLIFFNGCTTHKQAAELAKAGIPAVIGTVSEINDDIATNLAIHFYKGIGQEMTLQRAWNEAIDELKTKNGAGNLRGLYRKEAKEEEIGELPWKMYENETNLLSWKLKNQNDMLAEQLLTGLLSTYESGGMEFLKGVASELSKSLAADTLKLLGGKVLGFFKGKKEAEKEIKLLKLAVSEQNTDDFKEQHETVLALLKNAVETDEKFAGEVKAIIEGFDEKTKKELSETVGKIVKNIANIKGDGNVVIQGNTNSQIHIGDKVEGNKIKRQINVKGDYYENKDKNPNENKTS